RAIDAPEVMVEQSLVVRFVEQRSDDTDPGAIATPGIEAAEHRLPRPVVLGEVTPGRPGAEDPEDAVDDRAIVAGRSACLAGASPLREQRGDPVPPRIGEFVAAHGGLPK